MDGKEVILDIDDLYIYDRYGRVVAVIYLQVEESELMNVNKWLVVNGYAEITDYNNEFNPFTWTLYVEFKSPTTEGGTSQPIANIVINEVELNPPGLTTPSPIF